MREPIEASRAGDPSSLVFPVTQAQQGIWLGQAMAPRSGVYWTAELLSFSEPVAAEQLRQAAESVLSSCASLFTAIRHEGSGLVQQRDAWPPSAVESLQLSESELEPFFEEDLRHLVDLSRGPLHRAVVITTEQRVYFYLRVHHIALDGFGYKLIFSKIALCYSEQRRGADPSKHASFPVSCTLSSVYEEEQRYRRGPSFSRDRSVLLSLARLFESPSALPSLDRNHVGVGLSPQSSRLRIGAEQVRRVQNKSRELKVEPVVLWGALAAAFWRHLSGKASFRLGVAVAARTSPRLVSTPCLAMNLLPLRVEEDEPSDLHRLALSLQSKWKLGRSAQRYRYEDLRADLKANGDPGPLFAGVLNYIPFAPLPAFDGVHASVRSLARGPVDPWSITVVESSLGAEIELQWLPSLAERFGGNRGLDALSSLLADLVDEPSLRSQAAKFPSALPAELHGPRLQEPPPDPSTAFYGQVLERPDALALRAGGRDVSYAQLWERVLFWAEILAGRGVQLGDRVALLLHPSPDAIALFWACLHLGAHYLPLDPTAPSKRTEFVLRDADPVLVVVDDQYPVPGLPVLRLSELGPMSEGARPVRRVPGAGRSFPEATCAYVIYTSGTTGQPRGVCISRGALGHFVAAAAEVYGSWRDQVVLQFASLQFDASIEEIYLTLTQGGTLVLKAGVKEGTLASHPPSILDLDSLSALVEKEQITVLDLPTAYFHELVSGEKVLPSCVNTVIVGGEAVQKEASLRFLERHPAGPSLFNSYGPTETTVVCAAGRLSREEPGCLGEPLPGLSLFVVNEHLELLPRGSQGELLIVGPTLALGYLGQAPQTRERFVVFDAHGRRLRAYRSGDQACIDEQGILRFFGRRDDELKIGGMRIRILDVETALCECEGIVEAGVTSVAPAEGAPGAMRLFAYLVAQTPLDTRKLRRELSLRLPGVAIPSRFFSCSSLPRDHNGKLDRRALLHAPVVESPKNLASVLGRSEDPLVSELARLFGRLLSVEDYGPDDDFFEKGGNSLLALRALHELNRSTRAGFHLADLFSFPTPSQLAARLAPGRQRSRRKEGASPSAQESSLLDPRLVLHEGVPQLKQRPLFCLYPIDGAALCYANLASHLPELTLVGIQHPGLGDESRSSLSFQEMVEAAYAQVVSVQSGGPYHLLGWSSGGALAHGVACALMRAGSEVRLLALLDTHPSSYWARRPPPNDRDLLMMQLDDHHLAQLEGRSEPPSEVELIELLRTPPSSYAGVSVAEVRRRLELTRSSALVYREARHPVFDGDVLMFRAGRANPSGERSEAETFRFYVRGRFECLEVEASHLQMCSPRSLRRVAQRLGQVWDLPTS